MVWPVLALGPPATHVISSVTANPHGVAHRQSAARQRMIHLRTLGLVQLSDETGRPFETVLAQPKRLALLVYLATAGRGGVHRRDVLLPIFWPDADQERARDALNQALSFLRQALGPETFVRRGADEVGVDPTRLRADVGAFTDAIVDGRPADALALYGGAFLDGFYIDRAKRFEEWV